MITGKAEFARDLLIVRPQAGLSGQRRRVRSWAPSRFTAQQQAEIAKRLAAGGTVLELAREDGVDRRLIQRARGSA